MDNMWNMPLVTVLTDLKKFNVYGKNQEDCIEVIRVFLKRYTGK